MHLHPDTAWHLARLDAAERRQHADLRRRVPRRARPPSRWRWAVAWLLAHGAARLTDEPVVVLPRRA